MHGILQGAEMPAPLEDLKAIRGRNGLDLGDHRRGHVGIGQSGGDIGRALGLGRPFREAWGTNAGMVAIGVGLPVHVEGNAVGVEALQLASRDCSAIVAVGIGRPDRVAMRLEDCRQSPECLDGRRRDPDAVGAELHPDETGLVALEIAPELAQLRIGSGHRCLHMRRAMVRHPQETGSSRTMTRVDSALRPS